MAASVTSLPPDVLLEITQSLDAKSAMRLLETCKTVYHLSTYRPFWLDQLRALAWEHKLPNKTFDMPSMTLPHLRTAVARPYRFERSLKDRRFTRLAPLQLAYGFGYVRAAQLVPGGRWLVVLWEQESHLPDDVVLRKPCLRIFDISQPTSSNFKLILEHSVAFTGFPTLRVEPHPEGAVICFSAVVEDQEAGTSSTYIHVLQFNSQTLGLVRHGGPPRFPQVLKHKPHLQGNFFAIILNNDQSIFVWNWSANSTVVLKLETKVDEAHILSVDAATISLWSQKAQAVTVYGPVETLMGKRHAVRTAPADLLATTTLDTAITTHLKEPFIATLGVAGTRSNPAWLFAVMNCAAIQLSAADLESFQVDLYTYDGLFPDEKKKPVIARKLVSGDVVTVSSDNELCIFQDDAERQELFMDAPRHTMGQQFPFMCVATGVLGSIGERGEFYFWRGRDG